MTPHAAQDLPAPATSDLIRSPVSDRGGEPRPRQGDPLPGDITVVSGQMAAGHYSAPPDDRPACQVRFSIRLGFTGDSPAQYAWLGLHCASCNHSCHVGTATSSRPLDIDLAGFVRRYAQHAGRAAVVLEISDILKAIGDDGQDVTP
jgi:hypothetical protein